MKRFFGLFVRLFLLILFVFYYLKELIVSSLYIAYDIITPTDRTRPAIVEVPVDLKTDTAIIAFANILSMTPGSLTMDMSPDKKFIYVHAMYFTTKEKFLADLKGNMERKIKMILE